VHSGELFVGSDEHVIDMMATGRNSVAALQHLEIVQEREFEYEEIEDASGVVNAGRSMAYEAFMEEAVVIKVSETTDERAPPVVFVGVNGDTRWLPRGVPILLPRKFVERLAQSAERAFKTPKINASEENDNERPVKSKSAQSYAFSVLADSHPDRKIAISWLNRVTRQSC
jgi:hypothetical protein